MQAIEVLRQFIESDVNRDRLLVHELRDIVLDSLSLSDTDPLRNPLETVREEDDRDQRGPPSKRRIRPGPQVTMLSCYSYDNIYKLLAYIYEGGRQRTL